MALAAARRFAPRPTTLLDWAAAHRDRAHSLLLFHAASAGELRQAEPVIRRIRDRHPEWQLAVSYFSPSGRHVAESLPVDASGLAPWDTPADVTALLDALAPAAIVIVKHDLWPELAAAAAARAMPVALIAGTVRPGSSRLRWPARSLLAPAYASLRRVGAASEEDAVRLATLGTQPSRIEVLGDPRYDGVRERIAAATPLPQEPATLVAGSTWPADEAVLLKAFVRVREQRPDARLVLAPHEPTPAALTRIAARARALALPAPVSFRDATAHDSLLLIDAVGPLALWYSAGAVAYVGGGFGGSGVHSVLEPAAWGVPVIVGPRSTESTDARRLEEAEALARLSARGAAAELEAWWLEWLADPAWRSAAGAAAKQVVDDGAGAADRCAALVERLV